MMCLGASPSPEPSSLPYAFRLGRLRIAKLRLRACTCLSPDAKLRAIASGHQRPRSLINIGECVVRGVTDECRLSSDETIAGQTTAQAPAHDASILGRRPPASQRRGPTTPRSIALRRQPMRNLTPQQLASYNTGIGAPNQYARRQRSERDAHARRKAEDDLALSLAAETFRHGHTHDQLSTHAPERSRALTAAEHEHCRRRRSLHAADDDAAVVAAAAGPSHANGDASTGRRPRDAAVLVVDNLAPHATHHFLRAAFSAHGAIDSVKVLPRRRTRAASSTARRRRGHLPLRAPCCLTLNRRQPRRCLPMTELPPSALCGTPTLPLLSPPRMGSISSE